MRSWKLQPTNSPEFPTPQYPLTRSSKKPKYPEEVSTLPKKSNTQLICLTGLGGESIYNRFDNIYVLNLIAASLRGGTQYLKAEHKRGKEPDELVTARIEVGDQMELLF